MGASAQARKASDEHQQRAEASKNLEHALNQATEELVLEKRHRQYLLEDMSKLELEMERMGELQQRYDEACSELVQIKSGQAEEKNRLNRMLAELENKVRHLNSIVVSKDDRIKRCQGTIANLKEELSLSKEEASSMRPKIRNLKEVVDRVKADKIKALDQAEELSGVVTRLKAEVEKTKLDGQKQLEILQGELATSQQKGSESENRAIKLEAQVESLQSQVISSQRRVAEVEYHLALLKGARDVDCRKAFRLGADEIRASISQKYPELDLSFMEAEDSNLRTSTAEASEEDEYEDTSAAEVGDPKEKGFLSEIEATEVRALEEGEPSLRSDAKTPEASAFEGGPSLPTPIDSSSETGSAS